MKRLTLSLWAFICAMALIGCNTAADPVAPSSEPSVETTENTVQPGGISSQEAFEITLSYANWSEDPELYFGALNRGQMAISIVQHAPIYKFDNLDEIENFKAIYGDTVTKNSSNYDIESFDEAIANYDETFFAENTLFLVYFTDSNSAHRYEVDEVFCNGTSFYIHVEEAADAEALDVAISGWVITVAVPDSMVENCTEFDADLNNSGRINCWG